AWAKDRDGSPFLERSWIDRFRGVAGTGASILDLGCGTGEPIGRYLMEQGHAVTGVDSSPAMIAMCRERVPAGEWIVADMRGLDLGRRFGAILAWDSFFHLSHDPQRAMFPIFRAHAAPRAGLMFTSGSDHAEAVGPYLGGLYHASLAPEEYCTLLDANGFDVLDYVADDATCGEHTIWLAQLRR